MVTVSEARHQWMDFTRGIAILMVILHHAEGQIRGNLGEYPGVLVVLNDIAAPYRMPLLMMLSGFLLSKSLKKPKLEYVRGKLSRIGWPYVVWSVILIGLLTATGNIPNGDRPLTAFMRIFYDPPTYLWYLAYLLVFYGIALVAKPMGKNRSWAIVPAILGAAWVDDGNWSRMLFLFAFFLLGDLVAAHWREFERAIHHPAVMVAAWALVVIASVASALGTTVNYQPIWALNISASFVALIPLAMVAVRIRASRVVMLIGKESIIYYCTHFVFLMIGYKALEMVGIDNAAVLAAILVPVTILFGWALMCFHKRWFVSALFAWPTLGRRNGQPRVDAPKRDSAPAAKSLPTTRG